MDAYNDAAFTPTGSLHAGRFFHSSVAVAGRGVFVCAGVGGEGVARPGASSPWCACVQEVARGARGVDAVEFYSQQEGRWLPLRPIPALRTHCGAVLLNPDQILVVAGSDNGYSIRDTHVYDLSRDSWTPQDELHTPRFSHTTTLLDGGDVLVVGGNNLPASGAGQVQDSVERYECKSGLWQRDSWLPVDCMNHTATLLRSGKVLVVGGYSGRENDALARAFMYEPSTRRWAEVTPLPRPRMEHTATLLDTGCVLIAGGADQPFGAAQDQAFVYDPGIDTWTSTTMDIPRKNHSSTLLTSGQVLVVGSSTPGDAAIAQLYDPVSGLWSRTADMLCCRHLAKPKTSARPSQPR